MNFSQNKVVTLCAVGDISLTDGVEEQIKGNGIDFPFSKIKHILNGNDLSFANIENVFCRSMPTLKGQAHLLRSEPENFLTIANCGFNIVSLANNHILDCGEIGLEETISVLKFYKIQYTGAGKDLIMARQPVILDRNDISFGFLAYAMKGVQSAAYNSAGAAYINYEQIKDDILNLKPKVDHVVISVHSGLEFIDYPHPDLRNLCHKIADMGVSLIIGHHPHVIQGIERVNNCLIAYSLGNLIFDTSLMDYKTEKSQYGLILKCKFNNCRIIDYEIIPTFINNNFQPEIPEERIRELIFKKIDQISQNLNTDSYPKVYFKQASDIWPEINIAVNLKIIKEQGLLSFVRRLPRIKKVYFLLLLRYIYKKARSFVKLES